MAGGKIQHWKHGWIPISPDAKAYVAGKGPKPRKGVTRFPWDYPKAPSPIHMKERGDHLLITHDDFPNVVFDKNLRYGSSDREPTEAQIVEMGEVVEEFFTRFPGMRKEPVTISMDEFMAGGNTMATTLSAKPHQISMNTDLWDSPLDIYSVASDMHANDFGVTADVDFGTDADTTARQFRKNVLTHELAHVLHMRDQDVNAMNGEFSEFSIPHGEIDKLADEPVTPREMGFKAFSIKPGSQGVSTFGNSVDKKVPRWQADSLGGKSSYALQDKWEWFAEALTDALVHGDKASESGKRALALARKLFGREK